MNVFVVHQQGVERHECWAFSTLELAVAHAIKCAEAETDGYHIYEVVRMEIDKPEAEEVLVADAANYGKPKISWQIKKRGKPDGVHVVYHQ